MLDFTYGIRQISLPDRKLIQRLGFGAMYFLGYEGDPAGSPVKIGIASDPFMRFAHYQTANWRKVKVHEVLFFKCRVPMREVEASVHRELHADGKRHNGEWFYGEPAELVELAKRHLTEQFSHSFMTIGSLHRRLASIREEANIRLRPPNKPSGVHAVRYQVERLKYEGLVLADLG